MLVSRFRENSLMKKVLFASVLLLFFSAVEAQKVINDPNVQVRTAQSFHGISVAGGIDLYVSYGDEAVAVSASRPEFRDRIKTEVENGILKINYDHKNGVNISGEKKLRAYVSYKTLNSLAAFGGSDITVDGTIKTSSLKINISGGSDFTGKVDVNELVVNQSGGADVKISGTATKASVDAMGGSDFSGYGLTTEVCDIEASGGCDVEITASKELSAKATGASDISYKGKPALKEVKASGASSVSAKS